MPPPPPLFSDAVLLGCCIGDTYSCCAVWEPKGRSTEVLINARGDRLTPSAAFYHAVVSSKPPQVFVGEDALTREMRQPGGVIRGVKKYVGMSPQEVDMDDVAAGHARIASDATNTRLVYRTRVGQDPGEVPVERLAVVLVDSFTSRVQTTLGVDRVAQIVLTAPIYYTLSQRIMLERCITAGNPGMACLIAAEPIAAVVGSGQFTDKQDTRVLVLDVGGTSVAASVVEVDSRSGAGGAAVQVPEGMTLTVASASCDLTVGGGAVDAQMLSDIKALYHRHAGVAMPEKAVRKLTPQVDQLKRSGKGDLDVDLPDDASEAEVEYTLNAAKLTGYAAPLVAACRACIDDALASAAPVGGGNKRGAGRAPVEVEYVLLVGGAARLPHVKALCQDVCPDADVIVGGMYPPEEVTAAGAATLGAYLMHHGTPRWAGTTTGESACDDTSFFVFSCGAGGGASGAGSGVPPTPTLAVEKEKLQHDVAIALAQGVHDVLAPNGTQLPFTTYRYYAAAASPVVMTLLEANGGNDAAGGHPLGSVVVDVGTPSTKGPAVCVKVSISVSGVVEIAAFDVEGDEGGAAQGDAAVWSGRSVMRTGRLQALPGVATAAFNEGGAKGTPQPQQAARPVAPAPMRTAADEENVPPSTQPKVVNAAVASPAAAASPPPAAPAAQLQIKSAGSKPVVGTAAASPGAPGAQVGAKVQPQPQSQPTPPQAAAPSPAADVAVAAAADAGTGDGIITEQDELLLVDLSDRFQALDWFFRARSLSTMYPVPQDRIDAISAAMEQSDRVSQDANATGRDARAALSLLNSACTLQVGAADAQQDLMAIALGLWQFAVAPQEDDTDLLSSALAAKAPVAHVLGATGNTVLHEIAAHGALRCLDCLAANVDAAVLQGLLQQRNRDQITPLELAALDKRVDMVAALSKLVEGP